MQYYTNKKKIYEVEEVNLYGAIINVNGTSITDVHQLAKVTGNKLLDGEGYTVFVGSDEVWYKTFEQAYDCAMNKQRNTFWLED